MKESAPQPQRIQGRVNIVDGSYRIDLEITVKNGQRQESVLLTVAPDVTLRMPKDATLEEWLGRMNAPDKFKKMVSAVYTLLIKELQGLAES